MRGLCVFLLSLLGGMLSSCSSSSGDGANGTCPAYCNDECQALGRCHDTVGPTCVSDCESGIGRSDCASLRPVSQYTCDEIQMQHECTSYCAAFCKRVPTCGAFDPKLCAQGCAMLQPPICNPASVAARTCDQLKPEARSYEDAANAFNGGVSFAANFGGAQAYGLCNDASDCASGMGCSPTTNTCGPCTTDAQCSQGAGILVACLSGGTCTMVECLSNSDCAPTGPCDTSQHKCVMCLTDADCTSSLSIGGSTKCAPNHNCVQCISNKDCPNPNAPHCEVMSTFSVCLPCTSNADCAAFAGTSCSVGTCQ